MKGTMRNLRFMIAATAIAAGPANADPIWPIRPEPGLICMMVTSSSVQLVNQPHSNATAIATAGPVVFAVLPLRAVNGYVGIERPNKQSGWIPQTVVAPGPPKCVPTLMSNGLILAGTAP